MRSSLSVVLPPHSQGDLRPAKLLSSFFTGFPTLICTTQPRGCLGMTSHESVTSEIHRLPSAPNNTFHNHFFTQALPFVITHPPQQSVSILVSSERSYCWAWAFSLGISPSALTFPEALGMLRHVAPSNIYGKAPIWTTDVSSELQSLF